MPKSIGPEAGEYDERRELFNAMIDKRPRITAACEGPADVREALERAAHDVLPAAVRSGGHSLAGQSSNDDGLVIDVRPMKVIDIDAASRRARVGGTWVRHYRNTNAPSRRAASTSTSSATRGDVFAGNQNVRPKVPA